MPGGRAKPLLQSIKLDSWSKLDWRDGPKQDVGPENVVAYFILFFGSQQVWIVFFATLIGLPLAFSALLALNWRREEDAESTAETSFSQSLRNSVAHTLRIIVDQGESGRLSMAALISVNLEKK